MRAAVVGGGYVGQSTAALLALRGIETVIIDINPVIVDSINAGKPTAADEHVIRVWPEVRGRIRATASYDPIGDADVVIIAVNTPPKHVGDELVELLKKGVRDVEEFIDLSSLRSASAGVAERIKRGALISVETTIYPGGTEENVARALEDEGLVLGRDVYLVHAPERVDPGNRKWWAGNIPRVIGGVGKGSLERGLRFYRDVLGLEMHPVSDVRVAELSKIYENTYRLVNIAYAQEALMRAGVNVLEMLDAVSTKPFGIKVFYPGPYAGGTCLVKDSLMYYASTGSEIVRNALIINEETPKWFARAILQRIRRLGAKKVLIKGVGYKPGSPYRGDPRLNPVDRVVAELRKLAPDIEVVRFDERAPEASDVSSVREDEYDVVIEWSYRGFLGFIYGGV